MASAAARRRRPSGPLAITCAGRAPSRKNTRPPGASASATTDQKPREAAGWDVGDPEGEEHDVEAAGRNEREEIGLEVVDALVAVLGAVDRERLGGGVERGHAVGEAEELAGPDAGSRGELEHVARGANASKARAQLVDVAPPGLGELGPEVGFVAPVPPVVVLRGPGPVVGGLLRKKRVVHHSECTRVMDDASLPLSFPQDAPGD